MYYYGRLYADLYFVLSKNPNGTGTGKFQSTMIGGCERGEVSKLVTQFSTLNPDLKIEGFRFVPNVEKFEVPAFTKTKG